MKKIPTLFKREFENHKVVKVLPEVTPGFEWVLNGEGIATVKLDGSCCAIINGELYKRYDAKPGRFIPPDAIPCCAPDLITKHWPHWVKCDQHRADDKWFWAAYRYSLSWGKAINNKEVLPDGTYEAIGKHFNGNPYGMILDQMVPHGTFAVYLPDRSFEVIRGWLQNANEEGLVFWKDNEPQCKIKRSDFGFEWPIKSNKQNQG